MQDIQQLLAKSLTEIKRLKAANQALEQARREPIAIVGAACRYPGGIGSLDQLWTALEAGRDGIRMMVGARWPMQRFLTDDPHRPGGIYSDAMGLLEAIDGFDAAHFGLRHDEAIHIDPQHRLLMEVAWEAFEDAGYAVDAFSGSRTGVYVGIMNDDYGQLQGPLEAASLYIGSGIAKSCAAGRLAYTFGLEGPTLALDTACSSSLVGVHLAVQALRRGECDAALAGGVNLILSPQGTVVACRSQMLSPSGRCRTFDASADGYVRAEGCGLVLLKRLSDAERDGDRILALVRGSAVNHDGRTQGLTAPSGQAQRRVIAAALADAGVAAAEVGFVECHGTGTALGDPIELRALEASYVLEAGERAPLVVGALKSNLGHMESAAGIGGLHKAIQVVRHRRVPRNLHFETLNPQIRVDLERLRIAAEAVAMPERERALAGVSSFGFSGTNAHVIVEAYAPRDDRAGVDGSAHEDAANAEAAPLQLFRLAAHSGAALADYARRYLDWLDDAHARQARLDPAALCYTAAVGRGEAGCRIALSFETLDDLRACLREYLDVAGGDPSEPVPKSCAAEWVIGGAADVDWRVAGALHAQPGFYRERVQQAWARLASRVPDGAAAFARLCAGGDAGLPADATLPHTVHRWALAQLLVHLGLQPARVSGHGAGEYVAAAVAGLVDWDTALGLAAGEALPAGFKAGRARCEFTSRFGTGELPESWQRDGGPAAADAAPLGDEAWPEHAQGIVVELGAGLALRLGDAADERLFRWTHGRTNRDPARPLEAFLAQAYMAGLPVRWAPLFEAQAPRRQSQPGYPFQRERVWTDWGYSFDATLPSTVGRAGGGVAPRLPALATGLAAEPLDHPVLRSLFACPSGARNFSGELSLTALPYLAAHRILGEIVLPASAQFDLIATAGRACWPGQPLLIDELQLPNRCVLGDEPLELYCHLRPADGRVELHGRPRGAPGWTLHARARIAPDEAHAANAPATVDPAAWRAACAEPVPVRRHYHAIAQVGLEYEADFQGIFELSRGTGCALAKIALPPGVDQSLDGYSTHPILLDACLQAISAASPADAGGELLIPAAMRGIHLFRPLPELIWCRVEVLADDGGRGTQHAKLTIVDMQGEPVMRIDRFETTRYTGAVAPAAENWTHWLYERHWVPAAPCAASSSSAERAARHWLLLSDGGTACAALATVLAARGDRVSVLGREAAPADADGFGALIDGAAADGGLDGVIHGWSLDGFDPEAHGPGHEAVSDEALARCAQGPLWLCQAALAPGRRELALHFLTRGSQPAGGSRVRAPLAALAWGLVGSFVNEQRRPARLVDLDPDSRDGRADAALLVQALHADGEETQYAVRGARLLVARLRRAAPLAAPAPVIDPEASYLITGGYGQLGIETATALARQGARHLVLVGRDPSRADGDPALAGLREMGVRLTPLAADVGERASFLPRLAECLRTLPPLKGVVHSAGSLDDGVLDEQDWGRYLAVFAAKVAGTLNLHHALREHALDFFVLYSSAAALLGNPGQTNYAAANAFLDSFAAYRRGLGLAGLAIGWAGWAGGGMAAGRGEARAEATIGLIPPEQGAEVIARQFAHRDGDFALIPMRLAALAGQDRMPWLRALLAELVEAEAGATGASGAPRVERRAGGTAGAALLAGLASLDAAARAARLKRHLEAAIRKLLNRADTLDDRASMFDLGLDSLLSIDLRMQLEKDLACSLSTTVLHDHPTIEALAGFLAERVGAPPAGTVRAGAAGGAGAGTGAPAGATGAAAAHAVSSASPVPAGAASAAASAAAAAGAPSRVTLAAEPRRAGGAALPPGAGPDDIAIIGVSGRYPGAADLGAFWDNLRDGHDAITPIPPERWNHDAYFDRQRNVPGKSYSAWGGFIEDVDAFDPAFFSISPRMSAYLDPKERLFLETVWNLLEEAGETRERMQQAYGAQVGVFVGAMYQLYGACAANEGERVATALSSYNAIAHRTSYFFNLRGPSIALDTMCSSSLTAVHYACRSLLDGDCALAIAGGVNLSLHPRKYVGLSQAQIVGSHADSRSFSDGDGYLPAEGVGAVLLKPLARALADDDRILAVIKASSVNHGGRATGYYAPNANAQVDLMEASFRKAGVSPESIDYIEAAANGTSLGDAVELRALARVFDGTARDGRRVPIGTVKSNIGHPEAASGIAQLTKVILQMQHETLVPSIKTEPVNPNLDLAHTPFRLLSRQAAWPSDPARPRRATVSSFGASGANAHLIVEAFETVEVEPAPAVAQAAPPAEIVVLSARTPAQLREVARRLLAWLATRQAAGRAESAVPLAERGRACSLANLAHTLQTGREAMDCRLALLADSLDTLGDGLRRFLGEPAGAAERAIYHGNVQDQLEMRNLLAGAAGDAMAQTLVAERNLEGLMLHWVQGGNVPWAALREGRPARRLVLPTYPFERERYWLSGASDAAGRGAGEPQVPAEPAEAASEPSVVDGRA
ncbi:SDR family NAD(P)-dependent oxidoreductase [Burkholderia ambifaria]|uniref:type I polyketide synthase n=1 Tax=Burkholderia ambifaria TaxID=152480 RepID=UPI001B9D9631|nr:type I polyketide synthase [Burkholderia ambifaria]MBR8332454.1 SDR family NAD(P)-dependent oxidoreductase [Burkholderia ambifaria]